MATSDPHEIAPVEGRSVPVGEPERPASGKPEAMASVPPSAPPPPSQQVPQRPSRRRIAAGVLAAITLSALLLLLLVNTRGYQRVPWDELAAAQSAQAPPPDRQATLERKLHRLAPRGVYVLVDTYENRLRVIRDDEVLRDAVCSTGSGTLLIDSRNGQQWVFDTPLGERRVVRKVKDPVWVKPDWAFVEEGYEPPPLSSRERYDRASLGDYALYLGDGYLIHGTLFQTLLGQRVTHGCIRLGDEDLEFVYRNVPHGAAVYLY